MYQPSLDLPDHPVIRNMERNGYPDGRKLVNPRCPVCGKECETIYKVDGIIVGCDECLQIDDAWEVPECFPNKERSN